MAFRLYLNPKSFQFGSGLCGILVMNHVHPQSPRVLQIQLAVVNESALLRRPLRYLQRDPVDLLLRFSRVQITGAEKDLKVLAQAKRFNSIVIQLSRLIINGCYKIFFDTCHFPQQLPRFRILLRLGEHEGRKFLAGKSPRPVKQRSVQILVEGNLPGIECGEREVMPLSELLPVQLKGLYGFRPGIVIPAVRQNHPADAPKHRCNVCQGNASRKALEKYQKKHPEERQKKAFNGSLLLKPGPSGLATVN